MSNTVIALKKSATPAATPSTLANGELAINYADGKLYYKHANGSIIAFNTSGGLSFGTVNANGTLVVADTSSGILNLVPGNNIQITGDAINDIITISATSSGGDPGPAFDKANTANVIAALAYDKANAANLLAYNTGIGANAYAATVGTGANAFASATIAGANIISIAAYTQANIFNNIYSTIAGANTAVGAGANAFASATIAGANTAVGTGANNFAAVTIAGANTTVGTGANNYLLAVIAGANTAVGAGANNYQIAIQNGANTAVGAGANAFASATIAGANSSVGTGANNFASVTIAGANTISIAAFTKANAALANTNGTFSGNLTITGTVSTNGNNLSPFTFKNRIINGGMILDQRSNSASQTFTAAAATAYSVDRFYGSCTGANVTGQQVAGPTGFAKCYQFTGAASVTQILFGQRIESVNCTDLVNQNVVLSVNISNSVLTTVTWTAYYANSADTFGTKTQIATGTWTVSSISTNYSATFNAGANAGNGIAIEFTVGAQTSGTWKITGVQLELGTIASPFEQRHIGAELLLCQRYYEINNSTYSACQWNGYTTSGTTQYAVGIFKVTKRVEPTIVLTNSQVSLFPTTPGTPSGLTKLNSFWEGRTASGTGQDGYFSSTWTASAEL
mgnify:FL=1|jgi:hypothetical protein